jgi:hypothetical protein
MVTFKERSYIAKLLWILILTIISTIWISSQVSPVHGIPATTTPLIVKITSPPKGQQISVGHNVTLLGTSNYNASSKCQVSIIVDHKRPYQNTIPIGQGLDNYSRWKYTLAPTYTALNEGINRVTAKLICNANPALTKFYSINLTGINQPPTTPQSQQQIAIKSNGTNLPFFLPTSISLASAMSNSTLALSNSTNTPSTIPVSANSSSLIDPSSTQSSSSSSSDHSHINHHSHPTHHSSTNSDTGSSSSSGGHTHSGSKNHDNGSGDHSSDTHHGGGGGHDFFHGAFSHFGQSITKSVSSHFGQ